MLIYYITNYVYLLLYAVSLYSVGVMAIYNLLIIVNQTNLSRLTVPPVYAMSFIYISSLCRLLRFSFDPTYFNISFEYTINYVHTYV